MRFNAVCDLGKRGSAMKAIQSFVDLPSDEEKWRRLRMSETSGRPLGSAEWLEALEERTGRVLKAQKRGPKPKVER
jgi:putative transposase